MGISIKEHKLAFLNLLLVQFSIQAAGNFVDLALTTLHSVFYESPLIFQLVAVYAVQSCVVKKCDETCCQKQWFGQRTCGRLLWSWWCFGLSGEKNILSAFSYIADKHSLSPNIVLYIYIDSKKIQYGPLSTIIVTISIYLSVTIFTNKNIVYYRFALLFSPRMSFRKVRFCGFFFNLHVCI